MAIPYHKHDFSIETATKADVEAGVSSSKVVVPTSIDTAATKPVNYFATALQGSKADTAVQHNELGALAVLDAVTVNEISANGNKTDTTFLSGSGKWVNVQAGGDMKTGIYDPQGKHSDAFDMGNMSETDYRKILTSDERRTIEQNRLDISNIKENSIPIIEEKINDILDRINKQQDSLVPVGTTIWFDAVTAPPGFVARDGGYLNENAYPELFNILGYRYGKGSGTFGVGDFRGYFIRGYDNTDTTRGIGTKQDYAMKDTGNTNAWFGGDHGFSAVKCGGAFTGKDGHTNWRAVTTQVDVPETSDTLWLDFSLIMPVADEIRPKNINLLPCIKY